MKTMLMKIFSLSFWTDWYPKTPAMIGLYRQRGMKRLTGTSLAFSTFTTSRLLECASTCNLLHICHSFNFKNGNTCEMNYGNATSYFGNLETDIDSDYYEAMYM